MGKSKKKMTEGRTRRRVEEVKDGNKVAVPDKEGRTRIKKEK